VIVAVPELPVWKLIGPLFDIVKSGFVLEVMPTVTEVSWIEYPPFPSIVTVYVPDGPAQDRVEVSEPPIARLFDDREQVTLDEDEVAVSLTVAEKPGERVRLIVEVPVALPTILTVIGSALKPKSGRFAVPQMLLSTMPNAKFI